MGNKTYDVIREILDSIESASRRSVDVDTMDRLKKISTNLILQIIEEKKYESFKNIEKRKDKGV